MTAPLFEGSAVKYVLDFLRDTYYFRWGNIISLNNGRYTIVIGAADKENIAIILKRDWFLKFSEVHPDAHGLGDSINCEDISMMVRNDVKTIYIVYQSAIYSISVLDFITKSFRWKNKEGKEVRSISIHNYKRMN